VTQRRDRRVGIWIGDESAANLYEAIPAVPFGGTDADGYIAWQNDRLLHTITAGDRFAIAATTPGKGSTDELVSRALSPSVTPDGRTVVFGSTEMGPRTGVWKVDADLRHPIQLVSGQANDPNVTPDGQHVIFTSVRSGAQSPWIVSTDGGKPSQLVNAFAGAGSLSVSRDGRMIVFRWRDEQNRGRLTVCSLPACTDRRVVTSQESGRVKWMPDGRAVAFVDDSLHMNIWVQPIEGGSRSQLTHFTDGSITDFAWSPDGKRLAISRAATSDDIVLFNGLKR
jgi:Tol biopolymer transport system component